jgi:glutamate---cysteine ligase / carboxylate-amine ligase
VNEPLPLSGPSWAESRLPPDRGASAFEEAGGLTVGIEEELILVDPRTFLPSPAAGEALAAVGGDDRFTKELKEAQLEIDTAPCRSAAEASRELASARRLLVERLEGRVRVLAAGTHPAVPGFEPITEGRRYRELEDEYQWVARRAFGCGLHVHVAVGGAERSIAVFNAVRGYLPELAALSANSPFRDGEDTGLASVRQLGETFPRTGIPPSFAGWDGLVAFVEWGRRGGLFPDGTHFWWDLRPNLEHGTVELRIADAQTRVADSGAVAALFACLAGDLADRFDGGERLPAPSSHLIAENAWRALRYGVNGRLVDLETGEPEPARERIGALIERLEPVAGRLGCSDELRHARTLLAGTGADRQRYIAGREGMEGLLRRLVQETEAPALDALGSRPV